MIIADWDKDTLKHGQIVELRALSPAPLVVENFLVKLRGNLNTLLRTTKKRITDSKINDLSIASLLTVGNEACLLGADLEEKGQS